MTWNGRRVLVTGAGGFIGSHLAERLVREGAEVRAFVHYNALACRGWLDSSELVADMDVVAGDIAERSDVERAIRGCDTVFHLAALVGIPYSYESPDSYVRTNIVGTLNVLETGRRAGISRLVHTSTSEVYGSALEVPMRETHPQRGQSPYSATKIGADKMVEAYGLSFELPVMTVRPFNTFGPRQSSRAVVPVIATQLLVGEVVRVGSLTPTRDLNYVDNTVDGFLAAAGAPASTSEVFNLGSGREVSIGELVSLVASIVGRVPRIEPDATRTRPNSSEVTRLVADSTKARTMLGWQPTVGLEQGLERTVSWLRSNLGRYRIGQYVR